MTKTTKMMLCTLLLCSASYARVSHAVFTLPMEEPPLASMSSNVNTNRHPPPSNNNGWLWENGSTAKTVEQVGQLFRPSRSEWINNGAGFLNTETKCVRLTPRQSFLQLDSWLGRTPRNACATSASQTTLSSGLW